MENIANAYVYMLASYPRGYIYIGSTSDLARRMIEHKTYVFSEAYTRKHKIHQLVWYEHYDNLLAARKVEYQMKKWKRLWKYNKIEEKNKDWDDLSHLFISPETFQAP